MNIEQISWDKENYELFLKWLEEIKDLKYRNFHSKLILEEMPVIGIRTPILKEIAKQISIGNYQLFIKENRHYYYEENILHGLLIGYLKIDFNQTLEKLNEFLPYNLNWAINDITCANVKQFKTNKEKGYIWILDNLHTEDPWKIRFGFVLLLNYYITEEYIDHILELSIQKYIDYYYVNMAIAWLLSICYIKYPDKTIFVLKNNLLSPWIHNKTISKIRDSHRVSKKQKDYLKTLVR